MAKEYAGFHNSPCCIIRVASEAMDDGDFVYLRVGAEGCALPTGWDVGDGTPSNRVFFDKLVSAAMRLTGASNPSGLSGLEVPFVYFQWQPGQAAWETGLHGTFPDGSLLSLPFFESVTSTFGPGGGAIATPQFFVVNSVVFENTGGDNEPTYADFKVGVDDSAAVAIQVTIKLFHTLTT